jgi:hypothetical protein
MFNEGDPDARHIEGLQPDGNSLIQPLLCSCFCSWLSVCLSRDSHRFDARGQGENSNDCPGLREQVNLAALEVIFRERKESIPSTSAHLRQAVAVPVMRKSLLFTVGLMPAFSA